MRSWRARRHRPTGPGPRARQVLRSRRARAV